MKKRSNFILAGLMVFVLAMTLAYPSWAEDIVPSSLESKLSELIDSQNKLTATLQKAWEPKDQFKAPDLEPQQMGGDGTKFPPPSLCTADYQEWPSSDTFKKTEAWAIEDQYMPVTTILDQHIDLNGDGLVDRLTAFRPSGGLVDCVYLNNGRGWDLVHKCYGKETNNVWTFYGDCAKTE